MRESLRLQRSRCPRIAARRGLTLAELLVASTIMIMIASAMSLLAMTVHSANDHCQGHATAAQHGRVILERINRTVSGATASAEFPGAIVVDEIVDSYRYPQTLVVWSPESAAADPSGMPRVSELVLFTTDPAAPHTLVEIRDPGNNATAPAVSDKAAWRTLVATLRSSADTERILLSDAVRTGSVTTASAFNPESGLRGAVRFVQLMAPDQEEWEEYEDELRSWDSLYWPLDAYGTQAGMRRVAIQTELQLAPDRNAEADGLPAVPYFGSTTLVYHLERLP